MTRLRGFPAAAKGRLVRSAASAVARIGQRRGVGYYQPGATVVTVTWNSLPFLDLMLAATLASSPPGTRVLVVDNASADGTAAVLRSRDGVDLMRLPVNVGHGIALDLALPRVQTEYVAVLDVDAFPMCDRWLTDSIHALEAGAMVAGAHMHRNYVHPCFLVARTSTLRENRLTFRPVGSLARLAVSAPLFLDVGEALSQRLVVKYGGGQAMHLYEITSLRGPGRTGAVFGGLVYHNGYATQGEHRDVALPVFQQAFAEHHPSLRPFSGSWDTSQGRRTT